MGTFLVVLLSAREEIIFYIFWVSRFLRAQIFSNLNYFHFNKHVTLEFPSDCLVAASELLVWGVHATDISQALIKISFRFRGKNCATLIWKLFSSFDRKLKANRIDCDESWIRNQKCIFSSVMKRFWQKFCHPLHVDDSEKLFKHRIEFISQTKSSLRFPPLNLALIISRPHRHDEDCTKILKLLSWGRPNKYFYGF